MENDQEFFNVITNFRKILKEKAFKELEGLELSEINFVARKVDELNKDVQVKERIEATDGVNNSVQRVCWRVGGVTICVPG